MIGDKTGPVGANGVLQSSISLQANGTSAGRTVQAQSAASAEGSIGSAPYFFIGLAVLYVIWALVIQHERIRDSISPSNIAANAHNFFVVGVTAVLAIVGGKILLTKAVAWGIPGADALAQVWMAA